MYWTEGYCRCPSPPSYKQPSTRARRVQTTHGQGRYRCRVILQDVDNTSSVLMIKNALDEVADYLLYDLELVCPLGTCTCEDGVLIKPLNGLKTTDATHILNGLDYIRSSGKCYNKLANI